MGVSPARIYVDHGLTGTTRARPGLREAFAACRSGDMLVATKLDRLTRSLPDARDIADELTALQVKLNIGGSVHDPTDPVGRLLFNVLAMIAEFTADLPHPDEDPRGNEDRQSQGPTPGQATEAQLPPRGPPRRAAPRRGTHHHRARRALLCVPVHGFIVLSSEQDAQQAKRERLPSDNRQRGRRGMSCQQRVAKRCHFRVALHKGRVYRSRSRKNAVRGRGDRPLTRVAQSQSVPTRPSGGEALPQGTGAPPRRSLRYH
jgi:hypothetical protein